MQQAPMVSDGPRTPDDLREFVARAQRGSLDAFSQIVRALQDRLYNFLRQRTRCDQDAEDLTQETFLRAWREIARYDARHAFSTWLFTIGSRLAIDRSRARTLPMAAGSDHAPEAASTKHPADQLMTHEASANIWEIAQHVLTDSQRAALWLRFAEDLPPATIARILDMSAVNVRVTLHRAQKQLLEHVEREETRSRTDQTEHRRRGSVAAPLIASAAVGLNR